MKGFWFGHRKLIGGVVVDVEMSVVVVGISGDEGSGLSVVVVEGIPVVGEGSTVVEVGISFVDEGISVGDEVISVGDEGSAVIGVGITVVVPMVVVLVVADSSEQDDDDEDEELELDDDELELDEELELDDDDEEHLVGLDKFLEFSSSSLSQLTLCGQSQTLTSEFQYNSLGQSLSTSWLWTHW